MRPIECAPLPMLLNDLEGHYCLSPDCYLFSESPDRSTIQHLARTGTYAVTAPTVFSSAPGHLSDTSAASARKLSHIYLLWLSCQRS